MQRPISSTVKPPDRKVQKKELQNVSAASSNSLWLVKIPQAVYEKWANNDNGDTLGTLSVMTTSEANKKLVVKLTEEDQQISTENSKQATSVTDFVLEEFTGGLTFIPFLKNENSGAYEVKGHISKQFVLKPRGDDKYRDFVRQRTLLASSRARTTKELDPSVIHAGLPISSEVDFIPPVYADTKRKLAEQRLNPSKKIKSTGDTKDLKSKMFQAFEKKDRLTFKEIISFCQSNEKEMKDQLKDYALYHSKGPYKNYWELKPEYRVQVMNTGVGATTSPDSKTS